MARYRELIVADLMDIMPGVADLERRASRRIPFFAWEYLVSGTGDDRAVQNNLDRMATVELLPQLLKGPLDPSIDTELFGVRYAAPIGIAPVGLTGLIWPGADHALAHTAAENRIPYTLSTVATESIEVAGPNAEGMGWFQLYPPRDATLRDDLIDRAAAAGFTTLVVTADVPTSSRRERQRKAQVRVPPVIGPKMLFRSAVRPVWSVETLRHGLPRFRTLEPYLDEATMRATAGFVGANLGGTLSFDYLAEVRRRWNGPLVVKGIMDVGDARRCVETGADGVQVSNHGGRQLDGVPAAIDVLADIKAEVGDQAAVLFDSGVRSGLDVARALALGADFVFCGRAFMFGLGAAGAPGADHAYQILREGLINTMAQTGCATLSELPSRLAAGAAQ